LVILSAHKISFTYRETSVITDISFEISSGEFVGLCGKNGSGKTTLLKCLGNILTPEGIVKLNGVDITSITPKIRAQKIGYVPQSIHGRIARSVFDAVLMGRLPHITWGVSSQDIHIVEQVMEQLGLIPFADRDMFEISGGERQKALIARAIAQQPEILLLDEPTANLDLYHQLEVMDVLTHLVQKSNLTAVMAVHDLTLAMRYCSRILLINDHHVIQDGSPHEILSPDLIREVYLVDAYICSDGGVPHIVPIRASIGA
jgi:iron complex transport system ATP-binding protein